MLDRKLILAALLFLTACAEGPSDAAGFPPLKEYSQEQQTQAADELDALPASSILPVLMGDYAKLREQVRAFLKEAP